MASSSILDLVKSFCGLNNLPVSAVFLSSTDSRLLQLQGLLIKISNDIALKSNWQILSRRITWVSIAGENQGAIDTLLTEDPEHIVPQTFWDNTLRRPVFGPVSDKQWQELKAFVPGSPLYQFRIEKGDILINPALVAGHTLSLIYKSKRLWRTAATGVYKTTFTLDTDTSVFPDNLIELGLEWSWRRLKGKSFQDEKQAYELACLSTAGVDNVKPVIHQDSPSQNLLPGIWVPQGNWPTV